MDLASYPDINERRKQKILSMTDAELLIEIEKGRASIMPKCIPYMKAVLDERSKEQEGLDKVKNDEFNQAMLKQAVKANENSTRANRLAVLALFISLVAIVVTLVK